MRYRFHPLAGESLAVVRLHYVYGEPCYVVRRPDGTTVSVPAWMSELAAGEACIVTEPRVAELTPRLWKQHFAANPMRSDLYKADR